MLKIERSKDVRFVKPILHRVADIPGGVSVKTSVLGGPALLEGTPFGPLNDGSGLYGVLKTAKVLTEAANNATTYEVGKGHHFVVGDYFATAGANGKQITAIDKSNSDKDVITLSATLGVVTAAGTVAFQSTGANKTQMVVPIAVAGSSYDVDTDSNLFVDAWLIAVVKEGVGPAVDAAVKTALKGVHYVTV